MSERKATRKRKVSALPEIISVFTEEEVARLTGITVHQLRYWDRERFFSPSLAYEDRRQPHSRLYSFRDVVSLKVLNQLRNEAGVSLPHLREVKKELVKRGEDVWLKTKLRVLNKRVIFVNPETKKLEEVVSGQRVLEIAIEIEAGDMQTKVRELRQRSTIDVGQFEKKRNRVHNQLVIKGTRIPVSSVKAFHKAGYSVGQIRQAYPTLTDEDIQAAIKLHAAA
jgi:DNA-binding transcriptional MerR regulator